MNSSQTKVLVTGASGFIASHCIAELLKCGYKVKGSLRDLKIANQIRANFNEFDKNKLDFCQLDLLKDEGWSDSASDCDYLMHIASPFTIEEPKNEKVLIQPALEGTLRALKAANNTNIKKVVLTSSMASIAYGHNRDICGQNDWTDTSKDVGTYVKSKTLAEKAAWNYLSNEAIRPFKMTTIHPGMVFGPLINKNKLGASANLIINMVKGKYPALPNVFLTVVDVRDIAKLHVETLINSESDSKRVIATSQKGISFLEISKILRNLGYDKAPKNLIPNQVINSLAAFNKEMKSTASMIKRGCYSTDLSFTKSMYNWNPISLEQSLSDMISSIKDLIS